MENYFIVAIDMGSTQTKMVTAAPDAGRPFGLNIIDMEVQNSQGIRRGSIVDASSASKVFNNLILGATRKISEAVAATGRSKKALPTVYCCTNINGLSYHTEKISIQCDLAGGSVSLQTLSMVKERAKDKLMSFNPGCVVLRVSPIGYSVDNEPFSPDVVGREGNRLDASFVGVVANNDVISTINSSFPAKNKPYNEYATPSAKAQVLLLAQQKAEGVALVDLGASTTGVAVFFDGALQQECSIPFGVDTITRDLMNCFGLSDEADARFIKEKLGMRQENDASIVDALLPSQKQLQFSGSKAAFCIRARLEEIAAYVFSALGDRRARVNTLVLTGGGAKMAGVCEVFSDVCGINASLAETHFDFDDETCQLYAGAIGMASLFVREKVEEPAPAAVAVEAPAPVAPAPAPVAPAPAPVAPAPAPVTPEEEPAVVAAPAGSEDKKVSEPESASVPVQTPKPRNPFLRFMDTVVKVVTDDYDQVKPADGTLNC